MRQDGDVEEGDWQAAEEVLDAIRGRLTPSGRVAAHETPRLAQLPHAQIDIALRRLRHRVLHRVSVESVPRGPVIYRSSRG